MTTFLIFAGGVIGVAGLIHCAAVQDMWASTLGALGMLLGAVLICIGVTVNRDRDNLSFDNRCHARGGVVYADHSLCFQPGSEISL